MPEGDYDVVLWLGHSELDTETTVKVESRRLFLENVKTCKGEVSKHQFTVNLRTPVINDSISIRLKPREIGYLNWDNKLTFEFCGTNPSVYAMEIRPKRNPVRVFLAGNSTVTDQENEPWASWGQMITRFFSEDVSVANYAESGEALHSFKGAHRLDKILSLMQPGDYLFIEFGHNDQKRRGEGIGPWTSFTGLLTEFVERSREKGGIPVLVTPMHRRSFDDNNQIIHTHEDYPAAIRKVAEDLDVYLIDLNNMSKTLYEAWGPEESKHAFVHYAANTFPDQEKDLADNTHFSNFGAYQIARCIMKGIVESEIPLMKYLLDDVTDFNPAHPPVYSDWRLPHSSRMNKEKPDGN